MSKLQKAYLNGCIVAAVAMAPAMAFADPITLPTTGVDVPGHITALVTLLGTIAAAAIAAWAAFFAIRKGLTWVKRVG